MTFKEPSAVLVSVGVCADVGRKGPAGARHVGEAGARRARPRGWSMDQMRRGSAHRADLVPKATVGCRRRPSTFPRQSSDAQHFLRLFFPLGKASEALSNWNTGFSLTSEILPKWSTVTTAALESSTSLQLRANSQSMEKLGKFWSSVIKGLFLWWFSQDWRTTRGSIRPRIPYSDQKSRQVQRIHVWNTTLYGVRLVPFGNTKHVLHMWRVSVCHYLGHVFRGGETALKFGTMHHWGGGRDKTQHENSPNVRNNHKVERLTTKLVHGSRIKGKRKLLYW